MPNYLRLRNLRNIKKVSKLIELGTSVTWPKAAFFKNLNLRKKVDRNFCDTFLKNRFRHLKLYSNPPTDWPGVIVFGHLLKDKRLKFTFLRESTFQVLVRGSSLSKKT